MNGNKSWVVTEVTPTAELLEQVRVIMKRDVQLMSRLEKIWQKEGGSKGKHSLHKRAKQKKELMFQIYPHCLEVDAHAQQLTYDYSNNQARKADADEARRDAKRMLKGEYELFCYSPVANITFRKVFGAFSCEDLFQSVENYKLIELISQGKGEVRNPAGEIDNEARPQVIGEVIDMNVGIMHRYPEYHEACNVMQAVDRSGSIAVWNLMEAAAHHELFRRQQLESSLNHSDQPERGAA